MLVKTSANSLPLPQTVQHVRLGNSSKKVTVEMPQNTVIRDVSESPSKEARPPAKSMRVEMATQTPSRRVLMPTGTRKNKRASVKLKLDIVANTQEEESINYM